MSFLRLYSLVVLGNDLPHVLVLDLVTRWCLPMERRLFDTIILQIYDM